ncbi:hypothetical protein [Paenibacillus graminis]|uniref:hypothetical protein n=1 Tax=Paenibacillus graminis TaxID=189425 RepID=UPI0004B63D6D|nr:hypothetical protein [Paenibacillus graminis]
MIDAHVHLEPYEDSGRKVMLTPITACFYQLARITFPGQGCTVSPRRQWASY